MSRADAGGGAPSSLDPADVARLLGDPGRWRLEHVPVTGSTNADLAARAAELASGHVLTTDEQVAGRGRAGRAWSSPPRAGLLFSVLLRAPDVPAARRGWVGLALGVAVVRALRDVAGLPAASLKWPNDVLIGDRKCAGILGEVAGDALILGCGINVLVTADQLPRADATSLKLSGAAMLDRAELLAAILDRFGVLLDAWIAAAGDAEVSGLRAAYRACCRTLHSAVRMELPGGRWISGWAEDVDPLGALLVREESGDRRAYSAGDVVHVRSR
jgi:BirA family transcriptional regulator, biotin operon repressor / biotin---[acetyl-CoA-carboxylase] ligase